LFIVASRQVRILLRTRRDYLCMSRRETASNVLLGAILLAAFALLCLVLVGAVLLPVYAADLAVKHFLPGLGRRWDLEFYGLLCLVALAEGLTDLWTKRWTNAFLSLASVPMMLSIPFATVRTAVRSDGPFPVWPVLLIFMVHIPVTRFEFLMAASVIGGCVAVNTGLLGSGAVAHYVAYCILFVTFLWFVVQARRGRIGRGRIERTDPNYFSSTST
jgi:hypothetical protein